MNKAFSILNIKDNLKKELKNLIGYTFVSINSSSYYRIYNEFNTFRIEGQSYFYFYDIVKNKKRYLKMTFLGYDCIVRNDSESHGFNLRVLKDENFSSLLNERISFNSSIGFSEFILKGISFWCIGYKEINFPRYNNLIVFEFENEYRIFLVLGDRSDVSFYLQKNNVVDFFKNYPDSEERELILLYSTDENKN